MRVSSFTNPRSFTCNVHVLSPDDPAGTPREVIVVDPGYYGPEVRDAVEKGGGLGAILLTHGHWDHIECTDELAADWPGAPVYIHENDLAFLQETRLNGSFAHGFSATVAAATVKTFGACAETLQEAPDYATCALEVCGRRVEVLHTPGHTAGSCVFWLPEERVVLTGDTIMDGGVGRTDLPTGSMRALMDSLRRLQAAPIDPDAPAYVGHGRTMPWSVLLRSVGL